MPNIHVLPVYLVNKIAAGEVIERPASIVKELVENALDAGATRIDVAVEDGGKRLISVSDNGGGMDAEDLALAFVPHATSKISADDDLFAIHTMGFRGEALASIASVSHASIRTRRRDSDAGYSIDASGEQVGDVTPCAAAAGTTVTVRDLFFNTPGRRKFLKTAATEIGHITEQIIRLALPHPQVTFTLTHNARTVQTFPATTSTALRAADIFGPELADSLLPIVRRTGRGVSVAGLAAKPSAARSSGTWQYFFLNGRYIRDRLLGHALREAYRGLADPSRFPVAMVFITVEPAEVDVNVHPTKVEVRFRDSQAVHGELLAALRETLNRANLSPSAVLAPGPGQPAAEIGDPFGGPPTAAQVASLQDGRERITAAALDATETPAADPVRQQSLRQAMADFFKSAPSPQPRLGFGEPSPGQWNDSSSQREPSPTPRPLRDATPQADCQGDNSASPDSQHSDAPVPLPMTAVQFHNSYIITSCADGIEIIDQHALHERVLYNEFKRRLTDGAVATQRLLIPQTLTVTPAEAASLEEHASLLEKVGFELAAFGPQAVAIQAMPALLVQRKIDATEVVREVLDQLAQGGADGETLLEGLLETMACKAAVKAGDPLRQDEIAALLAARRDLDKSSACPHGRPTTLKLTLRDLQKQFKRT